MFVGHGLLAFAIATFVAVLAGWDRERAFQVGVVAGLFAFVPDVDVLYAPVALLVQSVRTVSPDVFWATANAVHRGATHSLVVGALLAVVAALGGTNATGRVVAAGGSLAIVAVGYLYGGAVTAAVVAVYVAVGLAIAIAASRRGLTPGSVFGAAALGLLSHPFGDLFTGAPPAFCFPFDVVLVRNRIALHPDPTVHLVAAFAVELATAWLAIVAYARVHDVPIRRSVSPRAVAGCAYAGAVFLVPAPTIHTAPAFVFSALAVTVVGIGVPGRPLARHVSGETVVTGLAALTVAVFAYATAYAVL